LAAQEAAEFTPPIAPVKASAQPITVAAINTAELPALPRTNNFEQLFSRTLSAAEAGEIDAQYRAALHFMNGQGTQTNYIQAMKWTTLAARKGHPEATALRAELRDRLSPLQAALAKRLISDHALSRTNLERRATASP
jgi:TPR repeat protein